MSKRNIVLGLVLLVFCAACVISAYAGAANTAQAVGTQATKRTFAKRETLSRQTSQQAFGKQTLKVGARGGDVYELQGRLKLLGFYTGKIDGIFSWRTYWAVRHFQYEFRLRVDGIVGPKTKLKLWKATKHWRPGPSPRGTKVAPRKGVRRAAPRVTAWTKRKTVIQNSNGFSKNDIRIIANAVHGEARGEPYIGKVAVAAVILNRVDNSQFPNTPSQVIFEPRAFTAVSDGQIWLAPNKEAVKAVRDAINGWDPTGGALYYYNPAKTTSMWIYSRPVIKRIGKHIFAH